MSAPALCHRCGNLFQSQGFNIKNGLNITFIGCSESCPRCGSDAMILDGTYNFYNDVVEVVRGTKFTRDSVERLKTLTSQSLANNDPKNASTTDEILDILTAFNESLGNSARMFIKSSKSTKTVIGFLMLLWFALSQANTFLEPTVTKAGEEVRDVIFTPEQTTQAKK